MVAANGALNGSWNLVARLRPRLTCGTRTADDGGASFAPPAAGDLIEMRRRLEEFHEKFTGFDVRPSPALEAALSGIPSVRWANRTELDRSGGEDS